MNNKTIGIMGAMPEEVTGIINLLIDKEKCEFGKRTYYAGKINDTKVVVVFSRWGKVAAATTASTLILKFNVTQIIFTGIAGAIHPDLNIGDIVIGKRLIQHDLDGRPMMEEFEIPLLGIKYIDVQAQQLKIVKKAVDDFIDNKKYYAEFHANELQQFGIIKPKLMEGDIASGDQFFSSTSKKNALLKKLPGTLCVEMEGAAVAQICYEYDIPFTIFRTISDIANEKAPIDFPKFIAKIANRYAVEIVKSIFEVK